TRRLTSRASEPTTARNPAPEHARGPGPSARPTGGRGRSGRPTGSRRAGSVRGLCARFEAQEQGFGRRSMKALQAVGAIIAAGLSLNAFAACEQPSLVIIPDQEDLEGNEREVVEATQAYFEGMQDYVECIQQE